MLYMREERTISENYNKVEFWGVTVVYVLALFLLISNAIRHGFDDGGAPNYWAFKDAGLHFSPASELHYSERRLHSLRFI
jgi:hypothetical protein